MIFIGYETIFVLFRYHLESGRPANGIFTYSRQLAIVLFGCVCLFIFDLCERGVQLR